MNITEADAPGAPLQANYSFSKIAGELVCTWIEARHPELLQSKI